MTLRRRGYLVEGGRVSVKKEKFKIVSVSSPRQDTFEVEVEGGTSFLKVRVYYTPTGRDLFDVVPTVGWDIRKYDRPTNKEKEKIIKAVKAYIKGSQG